MSDRRGTHGKACVLIADDDYELRRMLASALRKEGFVVIEASSGFELLERIGDATLRKDGFALIITDVRMPGVTGLAVVEGLRTGADPHGWTTPIMVITSFGDAQTHAEAARLNAVMLDKPFDVDAFRARAAVMASSM